MTSPGLFDHVPRRLREALRDIYLRTHRWFPYRLYEVFDDGTFGPARWQWPDKFGRSLR